MLTTVINTRLWSDNSLLIFIITKFPPIFGYFSPRFCRNYSEPPEPPRKKTPEEIELEKIDKEIDRLENLKRLMKEEKELERKLKESFDSIEPLKNQLENTRKKITDLLKDHPDQVRGF